jgi:hypothetical protein
MALLTDNVVESDQGFRKEIDEDGLGMVMDNLQKYQYQFPIQSTVREIASNAVDSHRERENVKKILKGEAQVSDFYVEREGKVFEASKFDRLYYDLLWLSDCPNIKIDYFERDDYDRDLLRFTDYGVGLGGKRLEGFFSLSYSTKRLNKSALGKFGIGAKAPLSTGVESYRMTSYYNGRKFSFDIYSRKVDSVIGRWDDEGRNNQEHVFDNGYVFYSEPTLEKNGVVIEVEVKKHQRSAVRDAIQKQLLYFDSVEFFVHGAYGVNQIPVMTEIFFKNNDFVISRNNLYTKPHLVLGVPGAEVNYGLINWEELELEARTGNIGIIVDGSEIEITPSRESVIWSQATKDVVLNKLKAAIITANEVVNAELKEEDFLEWINKSVSLMSTSAGQNPVLRQLSGMIDKENIKSSYSPNPKIKYETFKKMAGYSAILRYVIGEAKWVGGKVNNYKTKIVRTEQSSWASANFKALYFTRNQADKKKDAYILSETKKFGMDKFSLITIPEYDDQHWSAVEAGLNEGYNKLVGQTLEGTVYTQEMADKALNNELEAQKNSYQESLDFLELAKTSSLYHDYDSLVVPDDFVDNLFSEEDILQQTEETRQILQSQQVDHAKRRKENDLVTLKYASIKVFDNAWSNKPRFSWSMKEERADVLNTFPGTLVYATQMTQEEILSIKPDFDPELHDTDNLPTDENYLKMISPILLGGTTGVHEYNPDAYKINEGETTNTRYGFNAYGTHNYNLYPGDSSYNTGSKDVIVAKVSKVLAKKLKAFIPISRLLQDFTDKGEVTVHKTIMNWYTASKIAPLVHSLPFLRKFQDISGQHAADWRELYDFVRQYHFNSFDSIRDYPHELQKEYKQNLDKLWEFQQFIKSHDDKEEIAEKSIELFATTLPGALVVDMDMYNKAVSLVEWASPVKDVLNSILYFRNDKDEFASQVEGEMFLEGIRDFLRSKSVEMKELSSFEEQDLTLKEE